MKLLRLVLQLLGVVFLLFLILGMTSLPFWARYRLAGTKAFVPDNTQTILVMGGGGFPSESILMRLWYTAELAHEFPNSKIVLTTPGNFSDPASTIFQMHQYLVKNWIDPSRILLEDKGLNTRHQALLTYKLFLHKKFEEPIVVVTSPSHVYRSVKSFEKVGFVHVSGKPATEEVLETDLRLNEFELGGNNYIPGSGNSISLRYKFWDYLQYEIEVFREYVAIAYYKMKGWI